MKIKIAKRTFEALKYQKGSEKRNTLNKSSLTSEYQPSYKYVLINPYGDATPHTFKTKREAEIYVNERIEKVL